MSARIEMNPARYADVIGAMRGLNAVAEKSGLEPSLIRLIEVRASLINGCGYCIDMHTKDARLAGETEQRLYLLGAWREAPMYSPRERAALAWTDAVTRLEHQEVPDSVYREVREQFSEEEMVYLTLAIVAINGWNRFMVSFAATPGAYKAGSLHRETAGRS